MEQRSLRVVSTNKNFFTKLTNTISRLLIPTKVGINGLMISIKRNSLLKAFEAYQKETKDEVKKDNLSKKYEDAYTLYLEAIDKYIMDSIYKKVKNNTATEFEKNALSNYYEIIHLKQTEYLEYKYKKQQYLLQLDYQTLKTEENKILPRYERFYSVKIEQLYKGVLKHYSIQLADNLTLMAAYSKSDLDGVTDSVGSEVVNDGWFSELRYKQHNPSDVGSFAIFTNYRNVGAFSTIDATVDYTENVRGWTLGFDYVPMENTTIEVFYTTGTQVNATSTEGRQDVDIFRAQMEFYF